MSRMLLSPVVRTEGVAMPNGSRAEIHIHQGRGGYAGVLVYPSGHELPMSLGVGPEPQTPAEAMRRAKKFLAGLRSSGKADASPVGTRGRSAKVTVDTTVYRRNHGTEPRGFGNWLFVIGARSYAYSDDPALYRPAEVHGTRRGGHVGLSYSEAKRHAIAEARRRGASVVGVGP